MHTNSHEQPDYCGGIVEAAKGPLTQVTTRDYLQRVKSVGIKKLKAHLSEYVRRARAGETILVTERDEVVAELRPARPHVAAPTELEDALDTLAEVGELRRATLSKAGWTWKPRGLGLPEGSAAKLLDEVRSD